MANRYWRSSSRPTFFVSVLLAMSTLADPAFAQEQSRESMAVDATASQWSFQFAAEGFFDYKDDVLDSGALRPEGDKGFLQFRLVHRQRRLPDAV